MNLLIWHIFFNDRTIDILQFWNNLWFPWQPKQNIIMASYPNGLSESNWTNFEMSKTVIKYDCTCHFSIETRCTVSKLSFLILKISILKMRVTESKPIWKRVYSMLALRPKADFVKHFLNEGIPRSTIYSVIKRFEANLTFERKPKSHNREIS